MVPVGMLAVLCFSMANPLGVVLWVSGANIIWEWIAVFCLNGYFAPFILDLLVLPHTVESWNKRRDLEERERLVYVT
jgi:hypothetical protein